MKKFPFLFFLFLSIACSNPHNKKSGSTKNNNLQKNSREISNVKYIQLTNLSVTGDFDGDGNIDTLTEDNISRLNNMPIDSIPDYIEFEYLEKFFNRVGSDIILTFSHQKDDTLHLGSGYGLFCLINIGDNNKDKKDEIAFVVDYCNFTNISTCYIYTYCKNNWVELKSFSIHENAFEEDNFHLFKGIKGYLEYRKNKWMYIDYYRLWSAHSDADTIMKPLKIKRGC